MADWRFGWRSVPPCLFKLSPRSQAGEEEFRPLDRPNRHVCISGGGGG